MGCRVTDLSGVKEDTLRAMREAPLLGYREDTELAIRASPTYWVTLYHLKSLTLVGIAAYAAYLLGRQHGAKDR